MQAEIGWGHDGLRTRVAAALRPPSNLTWPAAAVAAGVAVGASVAKGQTKFAILPLCILVAICMAQIPAAGYIAILWSVGTAVDILALMSTLNEAFGKTIVMVTHDPRAASRARVERHLDKGLLTA